MNPALYTKWLYKDNGQSTRVKVVGIWGKGSGSQYHVVSYELKQDSKPQADLVSASKMAAMIKDGRLTYLAPGPEVPESSLNGISSAPQMASVRPEPNNRRTVGGQEAKKKRSATEAEATRNITRMEF
jgi:hypothetical protein